MFLGWGPSEGPHPEQAQAAHEEVDETRDERDRTPPLMLVVPAVLLVAVLVLGLIPGAVPAVERLAAQFVRAPRVCRPGCSAGHHVAAAGRAAQPRERR